jgi:hypothetical protein
MNRDFEFKQLLRAFPAGIISEETFESEMASLENGNGSGRPRAGFEALGKAYASEREGVAALLDRFRAGELNGQAAFEAWEKQCTTECIRTGIRMIAEREAYHARIFERRMRDLGLECKAEITEASKKITEALGDPNLSDNQKLLYLNSLVPDYDAFIKPISDISDNIKDDLESKELFKLFAQDEMSSGKWLQYACAALNGAASAASAPSKSGKGADDLVRP